VLAQIKFVKPRNRQNDAGKGQDNRYLALLDWVKGRIEG
jgi:hypothetical protein